MSRIIITVKIGHRMGEFSGTKEQVLEKLDKWIDDVQRPPARFTHNDPIAANSDPLPMEKL